MALSVSSLRFSDRSQLRQSLAEAGISGQPRLILYGDRESLASLGTLFWALEWAAIGPVKVLGVPFDALSDGDGGQTSANAGEARSGGRSPTAEAHSDGDPLQTETVAAVIDSSRLRSRLGKTGLVVLDLRSGWEADFEAPADFASGHIPRSIPADPQVLLGDSPWPDPAHVRQRLRDVRIRASDAVHPAADFVLVGRSEGDEVAGLTYFLLRLAGVEVSVLSGGWKEWRAQAQNPTVRIIGTHEMKALLAQENPGLDHDRVPAGFMFLDLRETWDFNTRHLPGAVVLPAPDFQDQFLQVAEEHWPGLAPDQPIVFYCYGHECIRSWRAAAWAAGMGYRNLLWFRGGVDAWQEEGLPLF
ncbi:MAG TPA: rhodanese-like domain-containing protein [Acidobacteriota bacterium]|nr:rhodanese-like domain-containing protein [Acidobacteriota bacterium]